MSDDNPFGNASSPGNIEAVRVAIVGAGIAGLTAAAKLASRGFEVHVFEDRIHLGGKLGAHPARVPLSLCDGIDSLPDGFEFETGVIDDDALEEVNQALDGATLPVWLVALLYKALEQRRLSANLGEPNNVGLRSLSIECEKEEPGRHGAAETRVITVDGGRAQFMVSRHIRQDESSVLEITDGVYHEHCYHMYLNWYVNFWALLKEDFGIDRSTDFEPRLDYVHLFPGSSPLRRRAKTLPSVGSLDTWAANILSGVAHPSDMFLWLYSVLDLVGQPLDPTRYADRKSVHGQLASRWYASEEAMKLHETLLIRAFAVPTYYSSAYAYQKLLAFTLADPEPMLWVLKRDSFTGLFQRIEDRLRDRNKFSCEIHLGTRVAGFTWDSGGRISGLRCQPSDMRWPVTGDDGESNGARPGELGGASIRPDYVILAVPPKALAETVAEFRDAVPGLERVRKLQSAVTASLDLHFTRKLDDVPAAHVILRHSRYGLTFFDNSQLWQDDEGGHGSGGRSDKPTHLSVSVSDYYKIDGMEKSDIIEEILADLRQFLTFDDRDVDFSRIYLQRNDNEPLFLNEVGSEPWRPTTITEIPNMFLAGDFVENDIDVVCVEGAVLSGLLAARAVQAQLRADRPDLPATARNFRDIPVLMPKSVSPVEVEAMKTMVAPHLAGAKAASEMLERRRHPERALSSLDGVRMAQRATDMMSSGVVDAAAAASAMAQWAAEVPIRRD